MGNDIKAPEPMALPPKKRSRTQFLEDSVNILPLEPAPKRFCSDSLDTYITQWLESAEAPVAVRRERSCRSDTSPEHQRQKPIYRRRAKSDIDMSGQRDSRGMLPPSAPASSRSNASFAQSQSLAGSTTSSRDLTSKTVYREENLALNNIFLQRSYQDTPPHITARLDGIRRKRDSPEPSRDDLLRDPLLDELDYGTNETKVEEYFRDNVFYKCGPGDVLRRDERTPMSRTILPQSHQTFKIACPTPDMMYGYGRKDAFPSQWSYLAGQGDQFRATNTQLDFPFLLIEFKADGPSGGGGGLWVATNQCLAGSATCINVAERLNQELRSCQNQSVQEIDITAFSIAMSGSLAKLYISWKHDEFQYYTQRVGAFCLQDPDHYLEFRRQVRNILDWGRGERLNGIRDSLDFLLEKSRQKASLQAKSRERDIPSGASQSSSSSKKSRTSG